MIVDGHVHLWDLVQTTMPWMTEEHEAIARPFGPADLLPLLERNGIDAVILVQGACTDADTDYLFALAEQNPSIGAVTAWVRLEAPEQARARLDELEQLPRLRAIRHLIHNEDEHWIVRPAVLESLALLEERDLLLELPVVYPRHFDDVVFLARRFPGLRIVIDHLGKPPLETDQMAAWETALREAAGQPNVLAKLSGLNTAFDRADWSADHLQPAVEIAIDCFGPDRLICGSDWPVMLLNGVYDRVWTETRRVVAATAPEHTAALLGENARRIYRLEED